MDKCRKVLYSMDTTLHGSEAFPMSKLFSVESPLYQALLKISLVLWMNILWLVGCLPILTIGASTTAYFRMLFNIRQDKEATFRTFCRAFASNFRQATALWLLELVAAAAVIALGWMTLAVGSDWIRLGLMALFLVVLFAFAFVFVFAGPLIAYFDNTLSGTVKNALAMGIRHYHQSIPALALTILPVLFLVFFPYWFLLYFPAVITFGTSAVAYGIMLLMEKIFDQYAR